MANIFGRPTNSDNDTPEESSKYVPKHSTSGATAAQEPTQTQGLPKFWVGLGVLVLLILIGLIAVFLMLRNGGGDDAAGDQQPTSAVETVSPKDWARQKYGDFEPVEVNGSGDGVVNIPEQAANGIVHAQYEGEGKFTIHGDDQDAEPLVDTEGAYNGLRLYGTYPGLEGTSHLNIAAEGGWKVVIYPVAATKSMPVSDQDDRVFFYTGPARSVTFTHDGEGEFSVTQYTDGALMDSEKIIDETGEYEGAVKFAEGPSVIVIKADGTWTFSQ